MTYRNKVEIDRELSQLEKYAVEWIVEDPDRFARLTKVAETGEIVDDEDDRTWMRERRPQRKKVIPHTIIAVVLSVPRGLTQHVTNALRASPNIKQAAYLAKAAQAADGLSTLQDEAIKMRMWSEHLEALLLKRLPDHDRELRQLRDRFKTKENQVHEIMNALREKRTDVAAEILRKLPDDEWG